MESSLISAVVITYNSSHFIVETLNSIKNQTYGRVELIVSDDCSSDETVDIVKRWVNDNATRFEKIQIIESQINCGITCNLNKGLRVAKGQYVKPIGGDDILLPNCLSDMYNFCNSGGLRIAYSDIRIIDEQSRIVHRKEIEYLKDRMKQFMALPNNKQYRWLLRDYPIFTAGLFISNELLQEVDYFDERYKFMEDYPFALKISSLGYALKYLDKITVSYRIRTYVDEFLTSKRNKQHLKEYYHFLKYDIHYCLVREHLWFGVASNYFTKYEKLLLCYNQSLAVNVISKLISYLSLSKIVNKVRYFQFINKPEPVSKV